jgi:hypothetical protein
MVAVRARSMRMTGVESELELPLAALHQLCGPLRRATSPGRTDADALRVRRRVHASVRPFPELTVEGLLVEDSRGLGRPRRGTPRGSLICDPILGHLDEHFRDRIIAPGLGIRSTRWSCQGP